MSNEGGRSSTWAAPPWNGSRHGSGGRALLRGPCSGRSARGELGGGQLSVRSLRRIVQVRARGAGIEGSVSGHSLSVGSAQSLITRGTSLVEMKRDDRWKSLAIPALYTRNKAAPQGEIARMRYKRDRGSGAPSGPLCAVRGGCFLLSESPR